MKHLVGLTVLCAALLLTAGCDKQGKTPAGNAGVDLAQGETVYTQRCAACHDRGMAGAQQTGKPQDWAEALGRGVDAMVTNSINGYKGRRGFMPARGGHAELSDADVTAAVHYMVQKSR